MTKIFVTAIVSLAVVAGIARAAWPQSPAGFQRLWYQAYDEGVRAAQQRDWATAVQALEAAKRGGPAPGRRVLFQGDRIDVFNPDYYLGLAYNATKRFAEAEAAFARVAAQGLIVRSDRLFDDLNKQTALASYERVLADGERALSAGRFTDVEKLVASAIGSLADDGRAGNLAKRSKDEAAKLAAANNANVQPRPPVTANEAPEAKVVANESKTPVANPPVDGKKDVPVAKVAEAKAPGAKVPDSTPPNRQGAPLTDNEAALQGATAYFSGNYEEAVRVLTPAFDAVPALYLVTFYLACSHAALVASGRDDQATLARAREMFANARSGGPLEGHLRYISPRVRGMLGDASASAR